jgi:hypothetical protein
MPLMRVVVAGMPHPLNVFFVLHGTEFVHVVNPKIQFLPIIASNAI